MYKNKIWNVTRDEKKIVIYSNDQKTSGVILWDGIEKVRVNFDEFKEQRTHYFTSDFKFIKCEDGKTLEQTRQELIRENEILKRESQGLINFAKQGGAVNAALDVFENLRDKKYEPEPIRLTEGNWIKQSTFGPIIFAEKYEGRAFKYDFCSHYPAIMKCKSFLIPYKTGKAEIVKETKYEIAIYRCTIEMTKDEDKQRLFRWNKNGLYPYEDIVRARELGLSVKLAQDDKPNVWYWEKKDCVDGEELFGKYVDLLFGLKQKKIPRAKKILNCLAGKLIAKDILKIKLHETEDIEAVHPGRTLLQWYPFGDEHIMVELVRNESIYESAWARLAPFLYSRARLVLSRTIEPHIKKIVYCHTDGWISTTQTNMKTGNHLGDVKYEGYCRNVTINHCTSKAGEFII